ncbi:MAG: hypothetical protein U5K81_00520 [Trueperaceae bacterium]|nr:hypothetical protein [Trueperaceae bacterium]
MDGTELWVRRPGSPEALRLFVGRMEGHEGPVLALITESGPKLLAVVLDDDAEIALSELLAELPGSALEVRSA